MNEFTIQVLSSAQCTYGYLLHSMTLKTNACERRRFNGRPSPNHRYSIHYGAERQKYPRGHVHTYIQTDDTHWSMISWLRGYFRATHLQQESQSRDIARQVLSRAYDGVRIDQRTIRLKIQPPSSTVLTHPHHRIASSL